MLLAAAALLPLACSRGKGDASSRVASADAASQPTEHAGAGKLDTHDGSVAGADDDARIVPKGLNVMALAGGNGVLEVSALTLRKGPTHTELYAALKNAGNVPACSAAFSVELFDKAEQSLAAGIGGLLSQRFYRRTDGSGAIAACIAPGDVTMAAITDLPSDIAVEDVAHAVYRCPYFALDVVPIDGLTVREVTRVAGPIGTAYKGVLHNGLDVAVSNPSVTVFPVNRVGRPLGAASSSATMMLAPGGTWAFETNAVGEPGAHHFAYPAGALAH